MGGGERKPKDAVPCDGKSSSLSSIPYPSRPVKQISHPGSPSLARRPGGEVKQKWTPLSRGFHAESRKEGRFKKAKPPPSAGFSRLLGRSPRLETGVGGTGY